MVTMILNLIIVGLLAALIAGPLSLLLFRSWREYKERERGGHRARRKALAARDPMVPSRGD